MLCLNLYNYVLNVLLSGQSSILICALYKKSILLLLYYYMKGKYETGRHMKGKGWHTEMDER